MTNRIDPCLNLPQKPFLTEQEIEEQFKPFTVNLIDSEGQTHKITAPIYVWDWFLILTWDGHSPQPFIDRALDWKKQNPDTQTLDEPFSLFITELIRISEPKLSDPLYTDANHERFIRYLASDKHPHYDELIDLQWRFDKKVKYPMAPSSFLPDPKILHK